MTWISHSMKFLIVIVVITSATGQIDPCNPTPCGPRTYCSVSATGAAVCRCLPGYFPKQDTIAGCSHQCEYDTECRSHERCFRNKCQSACQPGICGINADCDPQNHKAVCKCPRGFLGDPLDKCVQNAPIARKIISAPTALVIRADPCSGFPCGSNTDCRNSGDRPVCSCLPGYRGDPYRTCRRGDCESNSECPSHNVCQNYHCVNPCQFVCGVGANCDVKNHVAHCSCPSGYTGDPTRNCRIYDENELCNPSPCGQNTKCRVDAGRAICSCLSTFTGNPLHGCRHECESHSQCAASQACMEYKCRDPCYNACGRYANCAVRNHVAICTCPHNFGGDAYTLCIAECTSHAECPGNRACIGLKCGNPCENACGENAECRVEKSNHKAICYCPKGFTGHPFEKCRPQTAEDLCTPGICGENARCEPGFDNTGIERPVCSCFPGYVGNALVRCSRGECLSDSECGPVRVCRNNVCENPCTNACGINAECNVRNGAAICSCPRGFRGDALHQCTAEPFRGRRQTPKKDLNSNRKEHQKTSTKN